MAGPASVRWKISTTPTVSSVGLQQRRGPGGNRSGWRPAPRRRRFARAGVRRHEQALAVAQRLVEQAPVAELVLFVEFAELGLLEIDLVLQGQPAFVVDGPNGPAHGRQGRDDPRQELAVELLGGHVGLRQLRNLAHQRADELLGLFDFVVFGRLGGTHRGALGVHCPCVGTAGRTTTFYLTGFHLVLKGRSCVDYWQGGADCGKGDNWSVFFGSGGSPDGEPTLRQTPGFRAVAAR